MPMFVNLNEGEMWYRPALCIDTERRFSKFTFVFLSVPVFYRICLRLIHNWEGWHVEFTTWPWPIFGVRKQEEYDAKSV